MSVRRKTLLERRACSDEQWYQIDVGFAVCGVCVKGNTVIKTGPIFAWMHGRHWPTVQKWNKIVKITQCENLENNNNDATVHTNNNGDSA